MSGDEEEAIQATMADIMAKTSETEGFHQPPQVDSASNSAKCKDGLVQKTQKLVEVVLLQQQNAQNGVDSSSSVVAVATPLALDGSGGGRRSTSADSERSLRLEIAESSGGGTSGAEMSPLLTPKAAEVDNGAAHIPSIVPVAKRGDSHTSVDDKTPVAETVSSAAKGGPTLAEDEAQPDSMDACEFFMPAAIESKREDGPNADNGPADITAAQIPSPATPKIVETADGDVDGTPTAAPATTVLHAFSSAQTVPISDIAAHSLTTMPLVSTDTTTFSSAHPPLVSATTTKTHTASTLGNGTGSTIVTVSIAGKSAATITAAAAAAARSTPTLASGSTAAQAPPTLALMRAPIQPTPVPRILPRPPAKKVQQQKMITVTTSSAIVSCSASTSSTATATSKIATPMAAASVTVPSKQAGPKNVAGASVRAQFVSGSTPLFSGSKTATNTAQPQHHQQNAAGGSTTTKFAAVVPQRVGGMSGSCVAPLALLTDVTSAKEQKESSTPTTVGSDNAICTTTATTTTEMSSSSLDKFTDTVNRVAAGTEISPPHKSTQLTTLTTVTTMTSSTATTAPAISAMAKGMVVPSGGQLQQQQQQSADGMKGQPPVKPKPPKKKKNTAVKPKNTPIGANGSVDEFEQRNAAISSVVDVQQQQKQMPSSSASLFPVCSAMSSNSPGGGMLFPPNFALATTSNGAVNAPSLMAAYPHNGSAGGGITQYFIRQTTSSGHQQLIPVIPSQQQFFFSPMPTSTEPDDRNIASNAPLAPASLQQGQSTDEQQQQRMEQLIRNVYFRSGNDILLPAMVANNVVGSANVNLSSPGVSLSQNSTTQQTFVASTQQFRPTPVQQQQHKGPAMVSIQPKGTFSTTVRTAIAPKSVQPTGEDPSNAHQSISAPVVMIGGPSHPHPSYQQLASSQQQYFLTPTGAIVTLQTPSHHVQQQQHFSLNQAFGNARTMPPVTSSSTPSANTTLGDGEQYTQKNATSSTSKVSSPKRKRKIDAKNIGPIITTPLSIDNDTNHYLSQHQLDEGPSVVDEEENEPPPVLCRVFNRSEDEPIVSSQSVESVFQREAKIIRDRIFDANGKKFGPLKHFIDGFEIEEDIEPFPCEHQQLLGKLRTEQSELDVEKAGEISKEMTFPESVTASPEKNVELGMSEKSMRRKGRKRTATVLSATSSSATSSPVRSPKTPNTMETDTYDRMKARDFDEEPSSSLAVSANGTTDSKMRQQSQLQKTLLDEQHPSAGDPESIAASTLAVKKGRRRELDGLLKMDFGKHSPFQTSDPDKYAQEVLIEARQQQRTLALAQEEQRNARRSVESSGGGSTTGKSSKRDKYAKKPFSPPVSPFLESRSTSVQSTTPTIPSKSKNINIGEKVSSSSNVMTMTGAGQSSKEVSNTTNLSADNRLKTSPKDSLEQRRSGGSNASEEAEERCLYCRRSFKEVPRDKDHVQYCSKACRKQLKAAKRMRHSGGSLEDGLNNSSACDESRTGVASATPSHRRSDPTSSSDSSGQQQSTCHITSPLGSAFSAMQPQMLSKRRLPVDQHAEQLMSMNQRLSGGNGSGLPTSFASFPFGQSSPDQTQAVLAVPMAVRPTSGTPSAMIQYGTPTAMYFNATASQHQQMVLGNSNAEQQQQAAAVHAYQQHQHQQMLFTSGAMPGGSQQHFFPPIATSGAAHPGTPTQFLPSSTARHSSLSTAIAPSSSSPVTPVPTPTCFMERNTDIEALVARGVHTWTKEEVSKWVNFVTGSETNGERFVDEDVDGRSLLCLSQEQLKTELKFKLGPAIKLWSALELLKKNTMC